jgi:serine/threonine protein kinase
MNPGDILGPYRVLDKLGEGGMGEVYRARDLKLNREVAIKILPEALAADPAALARFEREAQAVAALSHPNILSIFDFGIEAGAPYAVMELLEGQTLREHVRGGSVPPRKAVEYALQIAAGLAAAHARGITHRDLKPANIKLTEDGRVKVLDFGLAKALDPHGGRVFPSTALPSTALRAGRAGRPGGSAGPEGPASTDLANSPTMTAMASRLGVIVGTAAYMSPEQVRGQEVDRRADIFALGAVLYELLAGRRAFQGATPADTAVDRGGTASSSPGPRGHRHSGGMDGGWPRPLRQPERIHRGSGADRSSRSRHRRHRAVEGDRAA